MARTKSITRIKWCAAIAALVLATPALADAPADGPDPFALQALRNYAACAVSQNAGGAQALLAMDIHSEAYRQALRRYAKGFDRCANPGDELRFSGLPFAGDLAEALIARSYTSAELVAAAARPLPPTISMSEGVGACVAQAKPAEVISVFATTPGSHEEVAALQATGDALGPCIPKGKTMTLNKAAVRAMYALGAYHLLTAPAEQAAPQG